MTVHKISPIQEESPSANAMIFDLKAAIISTPDFPDPGVLFRDLAPVLADTKLRHCLFELMGRPWYDEISDVTKIGAFDARGFSLGMALAISMNVPFFMLRKKGKLPGPVFSQAYSLEYGIGSTLEMAQSAVQASDRVLLVDDVLATGGTAEAGVALVEKAGAICVGLSVAIELDFLGGREYIARKRRLPISSVIRYL